MKPHSTGAAANMERKLAGNDRNTSTTSSSQKHLASLSCAIVSQHVAVRVPAHPSCTSRISVEVAHLSSVTPAASSSPATSSSSSTSRAWHRMPTRVLTPHLLGAVANAGTNAPCRSLSNPKNGASQKHDASFRDTSSRQHSEDASPGSVSSGPHRVTSASRRVSVHTSSGMDCARAVAKIAATSVTRARRRMSALSEPGGTERRSRKL